MTFFEQFGVNFGDVGDFAVTVPPGEYTFTTPAEDGFTRLFAGSRLSIMTGSFTGDMQVWDADGNLVAGDRFLLDLWVAPEGTDDPMADPDKTGVWKGFVRKPRVRLDPNTEYSLWVTGGKRIEYQSDAAPLPEQSPPERVTFGERESARTGTIVWD